MGTPAASGTTCGTNMVLAMYNKMPFYHCKYMRTCMYVCTYIKTFKLIIQEMHDFDIKKLILICGFKT